MSRQTLPDLRLTARTLIRVTAQAWNVEMGMGCGRTALPPAARRTRSSVRAAVRAAPADISAGQWPYWPAYPGLAAHWR